MRSKFKKKMPNRILLPEQPGAFFLQLQISENRSVFDRSTINR